MSRSQSGPCPPGKVLTSASLDSPTVEVQIVFEPYRLGLGARRFLNPDDTIRFEGACPYGIHPRTGILDVG